MGFPDVNSDVPDLFASGHFLIRTTSSNKSAAAFAVANRWSISLETCLMLMNNNGNIDTAGVNIINTSGGGGAEAIGTRQRSSVNALPDCGGFEIDDNGAAETAANRTKLRRHSFALKGSTKSSNKSAAAFAVANRWSISLETCLMLMNNNGNIDTAGVNIINTSGGGGAEAIGTRQRSSVNALPDCGGFEIDDNGAAETAANRTKLRRHSFALKGSTKSSNKSAAGPISLEPCLERVAGLVANFLLGALDQLGLRHYCCRRVLLSQVELIEKLLTTPNFLLGALDQLGLRHYCCRRMLLSHVELIEKLLNNDT
ncbi:hypothetical protein niasHS_004680 [Heterodera schachtii]|uniref:DNA-directed RNA polymerases I, II, and III subunit RPABC5 n=1 Tax=Heterodera schachtii TaxID=97005 RepID=A0ABD2JS97_HETSC